MKRKVLENPECPICGFMVETNLHILWQCSAASDVWSMGPARFQKSSTDGSCFLEIVEEFFQKRSIEDMRLFIGLARRLWLRRNVVVHGGSFVPPVVIFNQATRALDEFAEVQAESPTILPINDTRVLSKWRAPSPGWVKINWDGALNSKENRVGGGVVIRDEAGEVLVAKGFSREGFSSPI